MHDLRGPDLTQKGLCEALAQQCYMLNEMSNVAGEQLNDDEEYGRNGEYVSRYAVHQPNSARVAAAVDKESEVMAADPNKPVQHVATSSGPSAARRRQGAERMRLDGAGSRYAQDKDEVAIVAFSPYTGEEEYLTAWEDRVEKLGMKFPPHHGFSDSRSAAAGRQPGADQVRRRHPLGWEGQDVCDRGAPGQVADGPLGPRGVPGAPRRRAST